MKRSLIAVSLVAVAFAASASAASAKTVTALGTAEVDVVAPLKKNSVTIKAAVDAARKKAGPKALAVATDRAATLAAASGMTLGALTAVAEQPPTPFFYNGYGADGTFGPGKYCGTIRRPVYSKKGGRFHVVKFHTSYGCRIPHEVTASVSATFDAT
jgi:hypothetical protein